MNKQTRVAVLLTATLSSFAVTCAVAAAPQPTASDVLALEAAAPGAGDGAEGACGPAGLARYSGRVSPALADRFKSLDAGMVQKNYGLVMGLAQKYAGQFSYCYAKSLSTGAAGDMAVYAAGVGHFLTVVALAAHNGGLDTPQSIEARVRARVLLNAGKGVTAVAVQDLEILNTLDPDSQESGAPRAESVQTFTIPAVNAAWHANQLAFDRQYLEKRLRISGYLRMVTSAEKMAIVTVADSRGTEPKTSDITCPDYNLI